MTCSSKLGTERIDEKKNNMLFLLEMSGVLKAKAIQG